jgi:hypothetical protein
MTPPDPSFCADDHEFDTLYRKLSADIPSPSPADWRQVLEEISESVIPAESRKPRGISLRRWLAATAAILMVAVAVGVMKFVVWQGLVPAPAPVPAPVVVTTPDPLAEFDILPIATPNDVMVSALRGEGSIGLVACDHPLPGVMPLALASEMDVQRVRSGEVSVPTPGDAPIFMETVDK